MKVSDVGMRVLKSRYLLKDDKGEVIETPDEMVRRVSVAIAKAESEYVDRIGPARVEANTATFISECQHYLDNLDFLPNSPTLMNAGVEGGQLSACFLLQVDDDIESIFDAVKQMALIFKSGGGVGLPMSRLRPKGDMVKSTGGVSSGPVSFMRIYNTTAEVVAQGGKRRGALMGTLRVDHPDILEFVTVKQDLTKLTSFNVSVAITDEFMRAGDNDEMYELVNPRTKQPVGSVSARGMWNAIVQCAWKTGEPGLIFIDEINKEHYAITGVKEEIEGTNPCGEVPLLGYESCNLGSINLANFVENPYTDEAKIDFARLNKVVAFGVRFLDNVITVNAYPLPEIEAATMKTRKIGLGVMGFAEMLIKLGIVYGAEDSITTLGQVMHTIKDTAYEVSAKLAEERGPYSCCDTAIKRRNATLTAVAPTGSISMIAGVTGGIEPIFAVSTKRESVLDGTPFEDVNATVSELLKAIGFGNLAIGDSVECSGREDSKHPLAPVICAHQVQPSAHVAMQAEAQKYVCSAISKSVNLPSRASPEDVADIFLKAYKGGCKGITVYRDGCREHQPMSASQGAKVVIDADGNETGEGHIENIYTVAFLDRSPPEKEMPAFADIPLRRKCPNCQGEAIHVIGGWKCNWCLWTTVSVEDDQPSSVADKPKRKMPAIVQGALSYPVYDEEKLRENAPPKLRPKERPETLPGHTIKMKTGCGTLFVTVSTDESGNPVELFAHHGKAGVCSQAQCEAIGRLSSMSLRAGIDPDEVINQLQGITCHETAGMGPNKVLSCADGIAKAIAKALAAINPPAPGDDPNATRKTRPIYSGSCPKCGSGTVREAGCSVCKSCGWEKCS